MYTKISALFMISNIIHSYIKQHDLLFFSWLSVYTTSLIYHYTKFNYSRSERDKTPQYYIDVTAVYLAYVLGFYEWYNNFIFLPLHLTIPFVYFVGYKKRILMWCEDENQRELYHSMFHYFVIIQSHMYLCAR
jgi:hypothetical protein